MGGEHGCETLLKDGVGGRRGRRRRLRAAFRYANLQSVGRNSSCFLVERESRMTEACSRWI